jgi:hypothetical protein
MQKVQTVSALSLLIIFKWFGFCASAACLFLLEALAVANLQVIEEFQCLQTLPRGFY